MKIAMQHFNVDESDDPMFISMITRIINGAILATDPKEVYLVHIDNWFDNKWLSYSGKFGGMCPSWNAKTTLPPFVPGRVLSEKFFTKLGFQTENFVLTKSEEKLHVFQFSHDNSRRLIKDYSPLGSFFWFSGNSKANERGSLMAYLLGPEGSWLWYAGFIKKGEWGLGKIVGISKEELKEWYWPLR